MSSDWYLMTNPNQLSGFEKSEFEMYYNVFDEILNQSPETYQLKVNEVDNLSILQSTNKDDEFKILSKIGTLKLGDLIDHDSKKWLVINTPKNNRVYEDSVIKYCNYKLKIQYYSDLTIKEIPCVVYNSSMATDGTNDDKYMRLPKGQIGILIQSNKLTSTFTRDKRLFIHGNVWRIDYIDRLKDGILDIILVSDEFDKTKDNLELGIADYINAVIDLQILNPTLSLTIGETVQIQTKITQNGNEIANPELIYTSLDETIATVNSNGLITAITDGTCQIQVEYASIVKYVDLEVTPMIVDNFSCEIIGESSIINNQTKTYTVKWFNNGVEIVDSIASVNLSNMTLTSVSFTENEITVTADRINKGVVTLEVTSSVNGIVGSKDIEIKGIW